MSFILDSDPSTDRLLSYSAYTTYLLKRLQLDRKYDLPNLGRVTLPKVIKTLEDCRGNYSRYHRSNCDHPLCPICQGKKRAILRARLESALLTYLLGDPLEPDPIESIECRSIVHLTLTVGNCEPKDIRSTFDSLNTATAKLYKRPSFPVTGYFRVNEITYNTDPNSGSYGLCHPHSHILLAIDTSDPKAESFWSKDQTSYLRQAFQDLLNLPYLPNLKYETVLTGNDVGYLLARMSMTGCKSLTQYEKYITKDPNDFYSSPITKQSNTFATVSYLTKQSTKALWIPNLVRIPYRGSEIMYNLLTTLDQLKLYASGGSLKLPSENQVKTIKDFT